MKVKKIAVMLLLSFSFSSFLIAANDVIFEMNLDEIWYKAWEAYQDKDYEQAIELYRDGLEYDISNGSQLYNLACCYGLIGESENAAKFLKFAIKNGFHDINHINNDSDFDKVRNNEEFSAVVDSLQSFLDKKKNPDVEQIWLASSAYSNSYVKLPPEFDPQKKYNLVVGLHGYGAKGENFIKLWDRTEDNNFIYVCPETFYPFCSGKETGYSWFTWTDDEKINNDIFHATEEYVLQVTDYIKNKYNIDKTYLLGFSQGCELTYTTGIRFYDHYDGLICFGGWLNTDILSEDMIKEANELKIFIAHGKDDQMVKFDSGKDAEKKLQEYKYNTEFYEFNGGHFVPADALQAAKKWLGL